MSVAGPSVKLLLKVGSLFRNISNTIIAVSPQNSLVTLSKNRSILDKFFKKFYFVYVHVCIFACQHTYHSVHAEVRGQLLEICSPFSSCMSWGLNSGHQACLQGSVLLSHLTSPYVLLEIEIKLFEFLVLVFIAI